MVSTLKSLRNKYIACIYTDLIKKKSIRDIHRDIRKITTIVGLPYSKNMERYAFNLASKTKKQLDVELPLFSTNVGGSLDAQIAEWLFGKFEKNKVYQETNTISYEQGKKYEAKKKEETIKNALKTNRHLETPRVFYLASSHNDCAEDHKDYQGKIYIDENWKNYINDVNIVKEINKYINLHNVDTFQWVISKPVWFITRPNCRHFFKALDTNDVFTHDVATLIKNHKMHTKVGKKDQQTIKHPTKKEWYTRTNVEEIIKKYEERYEYHKMLYEANKRCQSAKRAMEKDALMIKKWKDYLKNMK